MSEPAAEAPGAAEVVPGELAIIKRAVAAAYRQAAGWCSNDGDGLAMLAVARDVEAFQPGDACCPCCEEVTCDTGCPLEPVRR